MIISYSSTLRLNCCFEVYILFIFHLHILLENILVYSLLVPTRIMQDQLNFRYFGCQLSLLNHETQDY